MQTNESIAVKFGDSVTLRDPFDKTETNLEWYLNRGSNNILTIYENGVLNPDLVDTVNCLPSNDNCEALLIKNYTKKWIGMIARQSKQDKVTFNLYYFLLTGYEPPLKINCGATKLHKCEYNATTTSLYVREDESVILECSASLWKYDTYDSPVELHINDCEDQPDTKVSHGSREGVFIFKIISRCSRSFSKTDKSFSCTMKYKKSQQNLFVIDELDASVEIDVY